MQVIGLAVGDAVGWCVVGLGVGGGVGCPPVCHSGKDAISAAINAESIRRTALSCRVGSPKLYVRSVMTNQIPICLQCEDVGAIRQIKVRIAFKPDIGGFCIQHENPK